MVIYIDVLVITSVYIDFLIIQACAAVLHSRPPSRTRAVLGALTGSLFSLTLLMPPAGRAVSLLIKFISAAAVIYVSFGFESKAKFFTRIAVFFGVSILFAGVCLLLSETAAENIIYCRNGNVYFDISAAVLIVSTAAAYGIIYLSRRFLDSSPKGSFTVTVCCGGSRTASFSAVPDTGNRLVDIITGIPVIVTGKEQLSDIIKDIPTEKDMPKKGWRLIPFETACGSGLIPIFKPEAVYIRNNETRRTSSPEAYIGVSPNTMKEAVFNPTIIIDN